MNIETSLVEQTQREILTYISKNKSGHLPKEQDFVEMLGVSRVVVREALSRLRALGIIETKRKKGTVVVSPEVFGALKSVVATGLLDTDTLRDLFQLRLMLEIGMADFIYQNKTEADMASLEAIVEEDVSLRDKLDDAIDEQEKYEIANKLTLVDVKFHSKLFEMTGNKSLIDFQYILRHLFTLYIPKTDTDWHKKTIVSHASLYNILNSSTADSFRLAMRLHLKTQFDNMDIILAKTTQQKDI